MSSPRPLPDDLAAAPAPVDPRLEVAVVFVAALVLLWPAFYNGYPLVYADTGEYISGEQSTYRTPFYGGMVWAVTFLGSLWPVVVVQAVAVAALVMRLANALWGVCPPGRYLTFVALLAGGTGLPWFVSFVMPDVFAAVHVLLSYLVVCCRDDLSPHERWVLPALVALVGTFHLSHLPVAAGVMVALAFRGYRRTLVPLAVGLAAAAFALVLSNGVRFGHFRLSVGGYAFPLARLAEDGPLKAYLEEACPAAGYRLCEVRSELPCDAQDFLWNEGSPFRRAGGWWGLRDEGPVVWRRTVTRFPGWFLQVAGQRWLDQLGTFDAGPHDPHGESPWPTRALLRGYPADEGPYRRSRQNRQGLDPGWLFGLHRAGLALAVLLGVGLTGGWARGDRRRERDLFVVVAVTAVLTAFVTGALSEPSWRYMGRVVWLVPMSVGLAVLRPSVAGGASETYGGGGDAVGP